jgi:methylmalonyl-CoA mutase cobalamin-binding domain/chain
MKVMSSGKWEPKNDLFLGYLLSSESKEAFALTREALEAGVSPEEFFEKCIAPVLEEIGNLFERIEIFLPEMTQAGEIVKQINETILEPEIDNQSKAGERDVQLASKGKVLLATVQGDIHDIGKNMVGLMLRVNGFDVIDIGTDVPPLEIVESAERENVDIIGLSSLLITCLPYMKDVIRYLDSKGARDRFKVIIGGASPSSEFAEEIGADGFGQSAPEAVNICKGLLELHG